MVRSRRGAPDQPSSGSPFEEAEARYQDLAAAYRERRLSPEGFAAAVAELRVPDGQGVYWQIDPNTGGWLRWDGQQWTPGSPPRRGGAAGSAGKPPASRGPVHPPAGVPDGPGRSQAAHSSNADPFRTAEARYADLVRQYQSGGMAPQAFAAAVAELRVQDGQGFYWQVDPNTGGWLRWDGSQWSPAVPTPTPGTMEEAPAPGSVVAQPTAAAPAGPPHAAKATSWVELLKRLPGMALRQFVERLLPAVLTGLSVWAAHSILLVWKNHGFNFEEPYGPYLNTVIGYGSSLQANPQSASVIWGLPVALFWSTVVSWFKSGPAATMQALVGAPAQMLSIPWRSAGSLAGFLIGGGLGMMLSSASRLNWQASVCLAATSVFLLGGYPGQLLAAFLGELWNLLMGNRVGAALRRTREVFGALVPGLAPGFLLMVLLPENLRSMTALGLLAAGIFLLVGKGGNPPATPVAAGPGFPQGGSGVAFLLWALPYLTVTALFHLLFGSPAHADDGGSNEISGGDGTDALNWTNVVAWWHSDGSGQAINQGTPPAVTSTAGAALIPPIAPPTGGLIIQDDVTKGETTKEGATYDYSCDPATQGGALIPADGLTSREFYAVCRTNNPDWTVEKMAATVHFTFTAPTGFSLQAKEIFTTGGGQYKSAVVICVPPAEAAYAPGRIPGVIYTSASSPLGTVSGHYRVEIQVGGGELILHPLDRDWLRGPMEGQPPDSLTLFARLAPPDYVSYTAADQKAVNQTITLRTLGEFANYIGVNPPESPEGWQSFTVGPNPQLVPGHFENGVTVEMGLEGRIMAGLLQMPFNLRILPYLTVKFDPPEPFLVKEFLEEIEVEATVHGAAPGEEWAFDDPIFVSGDQEIILFGGATPKPPAGAKFKFLLGALPEDRDEACAAFTVKARLTRPVKDYTGPNQTDEIKLTVDCRRPGLNFLTRMPVRIPADAKTPVKFRLTVLKYTPGPEGKPGTLTVDEAMLKPKALTFAKDVEAEEEIAKLFSHAALQITYVETFGEGLSRGAQYEVRGSTIIPGNGNQIEGELEISVPPPLPPKAKEEDYKRKLKLSLGTFKVDMAEYDFQMERKLFQQALSNMVLQPYSAIQAMRANAHKLEWEAEWIQSLWGTNVEADLEKLMKIHDDFKNRLDTLTWHNAGLLQDWRRDFYEEMVSAWQKVANSTSGVANVLEKGQAVYDLAKWSAKTFFPKVAKLAATRMFPTNKFAGALADKGAAVFYKYLETFADGFGEALANDDRFPATFAWKKTKNLFTDPVKGWGRDLYDVVYGLAESSHKDHYLNGLSGDEKKAAELKIKAVLYVYTAISRFFIYWVVETKPNGDNYTALEAMEKVGWDLARKAAADMFESLLKDYPCSTGDLDWLKNDFPQILKNIEITA